MSNVLVCPSFILESKYIYRNVFEVIDGKSGK